MSPSKLLQYEDQRARRRGIIKMNRASSQVINKPLPPLIPGIKKQQQQQQQRQIKVPENQRNYHHHQQPVIIYTHSPKLIHTRPRDFMSLVQKLTGLSHDHNSDHQDMELLQQRSRDNSRGDHIEYASSSSSSSSTSNNMKINNTINYSSSISTSSSSSVSDLSASGFDHHHQYPLIPPPLSFVPNSELFFCSSSGSGYGSPFCYSSAYQDPAGVFISSSIDDDLNNNIGTISNISPSFLEVNIEGAGFPVDYSY